MTLPASTQAGRQAELRALERRYGARSVILPVYGRLRAGKTELLLRFCRGKPTVYFIASDRMKSSHIGEFMRAAAQWLRAPNLAQPVSGGWERALRLVIAAAPAQQKLCGGSG